jgi:hypothetical protein
MGPARARFGAIKRLRPTKASLYKSDGISPCQVRRNQEIAPYEGSVMVTVSLALISPMGPARARCGAIKRLRPTRSLDRLITILGKFDQEVTVNFDVRSRHAIAAPAPGV